MLLLFSQNEILYEKKKKRRRLRLRRLGKRPPMISPQDGQPMNEWEKEMRQVLLLLINSTLMLLMIVYIGSNVVKNPAFSLSLD